MPELRIGSLFSGYAGLDIAVQAVLGGSVAWHCEIEPAAVCLLDHRYPDVPNLGDIAQVDWSQVERVHVLTGGFPCQDVSSAGRRLGMRPGTRSGLWQHMAYAIDQLRPELVVIENVRGLLSADAHCEVEPCPWCLGDDEGRPLRAFGAVCGDLADLGYDVRGGGLRAADVGAPHGRYRIFICAFPAADAMRSGEGQNAGGSGSTPPARSGNGQARGSEPGPVLSGHAPTDASGGELQRRRVGGIPAGPQGTGTGEGPERERHRDTAGHGGQAHAHAESVGRGEGRPEPARLIGGPDAALGSALAPADADGVGPVRGGAARGRRAGPADHDLAAPDANCAGLQGRGSLHPASGESEVAAHDRCTPADTVRDGREGRPERDLGPEVGQPAPHGGDPAGRVLDWGAYEPAIRRWELILGRPAPAPTMTGKKGGQQLSPAFVEWMMGLPLGHVTDVPGLSRNDQLKMLGNGVVPQQAATALEWLLATAGEVAA